MDDIESKIKFLTLGQNIKEIRTKLNLTQDEFSEKIDITSNFLSQVENGYVGISVDTAIKICKLANCSSENLFKGIINVPSVIYKYNLLNKKDKSLIEHIINHLLDKK